MLNGSDGVAIWQIFAFFILVSDTVALVPDTVALVTDIVAWVVCNQIQKK